MSAIQSSVGLITGLPIQDTVDQLISVASRPRNTLAQRTQGLTAEKTAIDQLSSLVLSTKFSLNNLSNRRTFTGRVVSSSNESAVAASVKSGQSPAASSYQFTPLRQASANQLVSDTIEDVSDLGGGSLSLRFGGQVDKGVALSELNGGAGFEGGSIKITDRAGDSETIDLRGARTIDDVLAAINDASDVGVVASVSGDGIVLTDQTGEDGNLRVREVNGGSTAASLGIAGTIAGDVLTGSDVYTLSADTELSGLRDGLGVYFTETEDKTSTTSVDESADLEVTLADGETSASIDLSGSKTLGDVIDAINANADLGGLLTASVNADGDGLVLTDTSGGDGDLLVSDANGGSAATDLGIASAGGTGTEIVGDRLISGLKDTLVSTLNAGNGLELGTLAITDRAGLSVDVDLSDAETLGELVDKINADALAAGGGAVGVTASINESRNGITLTDTSGGSGSLVVSGETAEALGLTTDAATNAVDGGSLNRQVVAAATQLEDFNGGRGVRVDDIKITDAAGKSSTINLERTDDDAQTLGDVIERINAAAVEVTASLNETGDGILLTDDSGGTGVLTVEESGSGNAAADLGLLGDSTTTDAEGRQTIDGTTSYTIDVSDLENSASATTLSSLNDGDGIELGIFTITNSTGEETVSVNLGVGVADALTIGDVVDRINEAATSIGVTAAINENQSGIILTDTAEGDGELTIADLGSGKTAEQLNLIRTDADTSSDEIDGRGLFTFDGDNALQTLADRINDLEAGVSAGVFNDGDGFRLSLTSDRTGSGNELLVDGLGGSLGFTETSRAGDAVALFGGVGGLGGFTVTSETNDFSDVIEGVSLTANQATGESVSIDVTADSNSVVRAAQGFVDSYNSLRSNLDAVTDFDAESETTGILFGRSEVVRIDSELSRLLTDRYFIGGEATSLQEIGIGVDGEGKLSLDTTRLNEALADSPDAVEDLFRDEERGVVAKLNEAIDRIASGENSLLSARSNALSRTIEQNQERIEALDAGLERQRDRLLLDFFRLEETISLLQSNTSFLDSIQGITIQNS